MHRVALDSNGCPALSLARRQGRLVLAISVCITPAPLRSNPPKASGSNPFIAHCGLCSAGISWRTHC